MTASLLFRVVNPPASAEELAILCDRCGPLPASYTEFLGVADGIESCVEDRGGDCLTLWPAREIAGLNTAYGIPASLPDFLAIGSDGGGDAVGFDRAEVGDPEQWPIVRIGFGNLDRADFVRLSSGFRKWLANGCRLRVMSVC